MKVKETKNVKDVEGDRSNNAIITSQKNYQHCLDHIIFHSEDTNNIVFDGPIFFVSKKEHNNEKVIVFQYLKVKIL